MQYLKNINNDLIAPKISRLFFRFIFALVVGPIALVVALVFLLNASPLALIILPIAVFTLYCLCKDFISLIRFYTKRSVDLKGHPLFPISILIAGSFCVIWYGWMMMLKN
jgi:hypothetical protein